MSVKIVHLEQPRPREPGNSRADYVGEMIREAIRDGHYKPGEHIPETDVASWLAVSRTPVREALRRLEAEGLLTFASWRGAVVAELDRQQVSELYAMREVLEAAAARLAAQQIGNVELDILGDLHAKSTSALADPKNLAALNRQFHSTIYNAAHNRYLVETLSSLRNSLALLRGTTLSDRARAERALEEHGEIYAAIRARNADAAEEEARRHIRGAHMARVQMMLQASDKRGN